jgi:hypothetical protein
MNDKRLRTLHLAYGIGLSIIMCVLGIYFVASSIDIYLSGNSPFTRERVGEHLVELLPIIIVAIIAIIGGAVLSIFPTKEEKLKGKINHRVTLSRLYPRVNWIKCPEDIVLSISKEKSKRKIFSISCACICGACLTVSLIYFLNVNNFPGEDITSEVAYSMLFLLPCTVIALCSMLACSILCNQSLAKQVDFTKKALAVSKNDNKAPDVVYKDNSKKIMITRIVIVAVAVILIIIGASMGGAESVLKKAINICTECIGMG